MIDTRRQAGCTKLTQPAAASVGGRPAAPAFSAAAAGAWTAASAASRSASTAATPPDLGSRVMLHQLLLLPELLFRAREEGSFGLGGDGELGLVAGVLASEAGAVVGLNRIELYPAAGARVCTSSHPGCELRGVARQADEGQSEIGEATATPVAPGSRPAAATSRHRRFSDADREASIGGVGVVGVGGVGELYHRRSLLL
jgi:hypothetical protein